ncbi:MAG: hypothetical protein QXM29_03560 [Nitrososphaerales archaeon]
MKEGLIWFFWVMISFLLWGFLSEDIIRTILGLALIFAYVSTFFTQYVKIEHKVKKTLEVVLAIITLGIIVYGYILTGGFYS